MGIMISTIAILQITFWIAADQQLLYLMKPGDDLSSKPHTGRRRIVRRVRWIVYFMIIMGRIGVCPID
jgi:hypothetical protein